MQTDSRVTSASSQTQPAADSQVTFAISQTQTASDVQVTFANSHAQPAAKKEEASQVHQPFCVAYLGHHREDAKK